MPVQGTASDDPRPVLLLDWTGGKPARGDRPRYRRPARSRLDLESERRAVRTAYRNWRRIESGARRRKNAALELARAVEDE